MNGREVFHVMLPDHPHDTRGALSYLREGRGAYGYLHRVTVEHDLLEEIAASAEASGRIVIQTAVDRPPTGGLVIYDHDAGRFPVAPTLMVHWQR
jgi:hypothetical protein